MVGLVTANQFDIGTKLSNLGAGFSQGLQIANQFQAGKDRRAQSERTAESQRLGGQALQGQEGSLGELAAIDPQKANQIQSFLSSQSESERAESLRENDVLTRISLDALSLPTEQQRPFLQQKRAKAVADGRDTTNIDRALSGDDNALNQALTLQAREGLSIAKLAEQQFPKTKSAATDIAERTLVQRQQEQQFKQEQVQIKAGELSPTVQKILDTSQTEAIDAGQRSRSLSVLAGDIDKLDIGGGLESTTSETLKKLLGSQDDVSELRRRFNGIRASQAVQNLPPGPASDKDIQLALSGFPAENAGGQQIASFLKGAAKLESINAAFQTFKSDLISNSKSTKGLLKKWNESSSSEVLGRNVKTSELFITAQEEGLTIEELKEQLGIK